MKTQSYRVTVYLSDNVEHKYLQQGNRDDASCHETFAELMTEFKKECAND